MATIIRSSVRNVNDVLMNYDIILKKLNMHAMRRYTGKFLFFRVLVQSKYIKLGNIKF